MVDVILSPVGPGAAPKLGTSKWWGYTSQWNLLDYPSVVFPVCKVDKLRDRWEGESKALSGHDEDNRKLWDETEFDGVPVSLQLVGRRFEDEKILAILEHLTSQIGLPFEKST